jgi:hypothetical protein
MELASLAASRPVGARTRIMMRSVSFAGVTIRVLRQVGTGIPASSAALKTTGDEPMNWAWFRR